MNKFNTSHTLSLNTIDDLMEDDYSNVDGDFKNKIGKADFI